MAAIAGVDQIRCLTLRQLAWMAEARRQEQWGHTAEILAMIHNANCESSRQKGANHFNPTRKTRPRVMSKEEFRAIAMSINRSHSPAGKLVGGGSVPVAIKS